MQRKRNSLSQRLLDHRLNETYTKTVLALDCARAAFLLCFQQKRRRFFDHRRIHQVEREISFNAVCYDLHGNYGIDKRWIHRTGRI